MRGGEVVAPPPFNLSFMVLRLLPYCSPGSAQALKRPFTTRFSKMMLTPRSALKVHEPYISHEIADSAFTRASFITEALLNQNARRLRDLDTRVRDVCEDMPSDLISCSSHEERAGQYCNGKGRVLGGQCGLPLVSISVDWFLQRSSFTQKIVSTEKRPEFLDNFWTFSVLV